MTAEEVFLAERALAAYERAYWLHDESDAVKALVAVARRVAERPAPTPDDREASRRASRQRLANGIYEEYR